MKKLILIAAAAFLFASCNSSGHKSQSWHPGKHKKNKAGSHVG